MGLIKPNKSSISKTLKKTAKKHLCFYFIMTLKYTLIAWLEIHILQSRNDHVIASSNSKKWNKTQLLQEKPFFFLFVKWRWMKRGSATYCFARLPAIWHCFRKFSLRVFALFCPVNLCPTSSFASSGNKKGSKNEMRPWMYVVRPVF